MHRLEIKTELPDDFLAYWMHVKEIKETEAYLNASDLCYALTLGFLLSFVISVNYVFVGYSLPPFLCL